MELNAHRILLGCIVLGWLAGGTGCTLDIEVPETCPENTCVGETASNGSTSNGTTSEDTGEDTDTTTSMDTGEDEDTGPSGQCLEMLDYCPIPSTNCTDACNTILGAWPPPNQPPFIVSDAHLQASVNVLQDASTLFMSVVSWGVGRPKINVARAQDASYANRILDTVGSNTFSLAGGFFYEAPALAKQVRFETNNRTARLMVPHLSINQDSPFLEMTLTEFGIDAAFDLFKTTTFDPLSDELRGVKHIYQPSWHQQGNYGLIGWQYEGFATVRKIEEERNNDAVVFDPTVQIAGCEEQNSLLRTSSVAVLKKVDNTNWFYTDCHSTGAADDEPFNPPQFNWFDGIDSFKTVVHGANTGIETEVSWVGQPFSPAVVYPGTEDTSEGAFMARVVGVGGALNVEVIHGLALAPTSYVYTGLQPLIDELDLDAELAACPSQIDGIALADVAGEDMLPEIVVLVRLAKDCNPASPAGNSVASVLVRLSWENGGLLPVVFGGGRTAILLEDLFATGPLVADIAGDGQQEYLVGALGDVSKRRAGNIALYAMRYINEDGEVTLLDGVLGEQGLQNIEDPDITPRPVPSSDVGYFELPIAVGEFSSESEGFELVVLRMYGRAVEQDIRAARIVLYQLNANSAQWPMRLGNSGQTGAWGALE